MITNTRFFFQQTLESCESECEWWPVCDHQLSLIIRSFRLLFHVFKIYYTLFSHLEVSAIILWENISINSPIIIFIIFVSGFFFTQQINCLPPALLHENKFQIILITLVHHSRKQIFYRERKLEMKKKSD